MSLQTETEFELRDIYKETSAFFADLRRQNDFGYMKFNSPPLHKAEVLFIGYQPGGGEEFFKYEKSLKTHLTWPQKAEYATASWHLAVRIREMFQPTIDLNKTVGLNAIFLRSPNITHYKRDVTSANRKKLHAFCFNQVGKIVELLKPRKIITIGLETLKLFGPTQSDLINSWGECLHTAGTGCWA